MPSITEIQAVLNGQVFEDLTDSNRQLGSTAAVASGDQVRPVNRITSGSWLTFLPALVSLPSIVFMS